MAETTQSKTTKKTTAKKKAPESVAEPVVTVDEEVEAREPVPEQPKKQPEKIDESQYVTVRNGFHGTLVYISPRTGERYDWPEYGDEQEMELRELKSAKSSQKTFFTENWFLLDDWVIRYLGVEQYYRRTFDRRELDKLLKCAPDKIYTEVSAMSPGQKESVAYRVRAMIESGEIDSLRVISALEKALGTELIER